MINKIKITGIFEQFNYTIPLNIEEKVTIITGIMGMVKQ